MPLSIKKMVLEHSEAGEHVSDIALEYREHEDGLNYLILSQNKREVWISTEDWDTLVARAEAVISL